MADAITLTDQDDGQSIPAALAASPATRKPRAKAGKVARPAASPVPAAFADASVPAAAEPVLAAEAAPEPEAPVAEAQAEPVAEVASEPAADIEPVPAPEPAPVPVVATDPEPVSLPPAAVPAEPQKESIMATTIDSLTTNTAKAQAFFADANERAKGAAAKSAKMFEDATAFGKGNVEAMVESSKIAAKAFETLGQDAAEFGRKSFEDATAALKTLAAAKSPTEFLKLQGEFVRQSFDSLVAETSRSTETVLKLAGEVAQPISNRLAVAADKMKPAA